MLNFELTESTIALSGALGIDVAEELRQRLLEAIAERSSELSVDLSGVTRIDTAIVQVLLALRAQQPTARIVNATEEVAHWLTIVGVAEQLT